jgi:hypothetical protein
MDFCAPAKLLGGKNMYKCLARVAAELDFQSRACHNRRPVILAFIWHCPNSVRVMHFNMWDAPFEGRCPSLKGAALSGLIVKPQGGEIFKHRATPDETQARHVEMHRVSRTKQRYEL